jgi:hypothetical protein
MIDRLGCAGEGRLFRRHAAPQVGAVRVPEADDLATVDGFVRDREIEPMVELRAAKELELALLR